MTQRSNLPSDYLPLTPIAFEILLSLAEGDRHGYAVLLDIRERTEGRLSLYPGTLYRAIDRQMSLGLVRSVDPTGAPEKAAPRSTYYGLTELGRAVGMAEAERLRRQVVAARRRHLLGTDT